MEEQLNQSNSNVAQETKLKFYHWLSKVKIYLAENWNQFQTASKREKKETLEAIGILQLLLLGKPVTELQKKFLKAQSVDLIKILFLIAFKLIPSPLPITVLAIWLGKKINFNFLPSSQSNFSSKK